MFNVSSDIDKGNFKRDDIIKRRSFLNEVFTSIEDGFQKFFKINEFSKICVPNIVSVTGACENLNTLFQVDSNNPHINRLSQTGQLYLEAELVHHKKVWCITKSFRKELKESKRHLTEFNLIELEGNFNFNTLLNHMRDSYKTALDCLLRNVPREIISSLKVDTDFIEIQIQSDIPAVSYSECIKQIGDIKWGDDLSSHQEQQILSYYTGGRIPILITHFPKHIKFFNMSHDDENPSLALSVDLILPYSGEAAGGAQRESDYVRLKASLMNSAMYNLHLEQGGTYSDFECYLKLIESGKLQLHSGCGFGVERIIQSALSSDDIRMCSIDYLSNMFFMPEAICL